MHLTEVRARYGETDQGGVVYHAHYLQWFEVGRTAFLRDQGCSYAVLEREADLILPVVRAELDYLKPAFYDDLLQVETRVEWIRRVRFRLQTRIMRPADGAVLCTGALELAAVRRSDRKIVALPEPLLGALQRGLEPAG